MTPKAALDLPTLESWLWEAACVIRGPIDAPKLKDYIPPLIFPERLSDVFDDEVRHLAHDFGSEKQALKLVGQDHKLVRFSIPPAARWGGPKNYLEEGHITALADVSPAWRPVDGWSAIISTSQAAAGDYQLSPPPHVRTASIGCFDRSCTV